MGDATKVDLEAWDRDMKINVTSMVLMARHVIPEMVRAQVLWIIGAELLIRSPCRGNPAEERSSTCRRSVVVGVPPFARRKRVLTVRSIGRQPVALVPDFERGHHTDDTSDGGAAWQGEYSCELRLPGNGLHADGTRARHDGRDAKGSRWPEPDGSRGHSVGRRIRGLVPVQ